MSRKSVWLLSGREDLRRFLESFLGTHGYGVRSYSEASSLLVSLGRDELPEILLSDDPPPGLDRVTIEARFRELAPFVRCVFLSDAGAGLLPDESRRFSTDDITLNPNELLELMEKLVSESSRDDLTAPKSDPASDFKRALLQTLATFVALVERYEYLNYGNGPLVQRYAVEVAKELGLSAARVDAIAAASILYDIGMIKVRSEIKLKASALTSEEMGAIREHPRHSAEFVESLGLPWDLRRYILHHQERYDGKGYPDGLSGREIPIGARIIAVADAYFAMIGKRPNREPMSEIDALNELQRQAGSQFDPEIVEVFSSLIQVRFLGETDAETETSPQLRRIALVDDDRELRVLLDMKLSTLGYQVVTIVDGERVMPLLIDAAPDAIIVNADLDWIDAWSLLHNVRREPVLGGIPFILLSGLKTSPADRARAEAQGADDYIIRPSPLQELVSRVNAAIRKKKRLTREHFVRSPGQAGIRGPLSEMGLTEICQVLAQGFKTAKVTIVDSQTEGQLWFHEGKLKHATYGDREGADAFYALLRIKEGEFAIEHGVPPLAETVHDRLEFLLMEGMRLMDEERRPA